MKKKNTTLIKSQQNIKTNTYPLRNNHQPSPEEFKADIFQLTNGKLSVTSDYINAKTKVYVKCNDCKHTFKILADNLKRRLSCPKCNKKRGQYKQRTFQTLYNEFCNHNQSAKEYIIYTSLIPTEPCSKKSKIEIKHKSCGRSTFISPYDLLDHECKECKEKKRQLTETQRFIKQVKKLEGSNYSVIKGTYINNLSEFTLLHHKCNHIFTTTPNRFKSAGSRCPYCSISKGESWVKKALEELGINYEFNVIDPNCRYKSYLKFDFIIPETDNMPEWRIEYDGRQHFDKSFQKDPVNAKEELKAIIKRDNIKNTYCKEQKIPLLRIPYTQRSYALVKNTLEFYLNYGWVHNRVLNFYTRFSPSTYSRNHAEYNSLEV